MSESPDKRLVLVDGSGYIFRAFFALPPMTRPDGTPVNAVFGFANMLFKLMQERPRRRPRRRVRPWPRELQERSSTTPTRPTATSRRPSSGRSSQLVRDAARAFGLPVVEVEGYEADDLIAAYAKQAQGGGRAGHHRLLRQGPDAARRRRGRDVGPDEAEGDRPRGGDRAVRRRAGAGARRAGADRRHLGQRAGRARDRAQERRPSCSTEFGSLEGLLANLDKIKQPKRRESLEQNAELARLSYRLVCLDDDAPLPLGLDELRRRPFDAADTAGVPAGERLPLAGRPDRAARRRRPSAARTERAAERRAALAADRPRSASSTTLLARAVEAGLLAIDTETTSLDLARARLVGVCLAVEAGRGLLRAARPCRRVRPAPRRASSTCPR